MGYSSGFYAAIIISVIQTVIYTLKEESALTSPVQVRFAYTRLLILCQVLFLGWLYWVPTVGTFALVLFGYCLMARILSLLPGNRTEPMSLDLIRRTFLTPPALGNVHHGLPAASCPGGVCVLEDVLQLFPPGQGLKTQTNQTINQNYAHHNWGRRRIRSKSYA
jgi:hypothetical protein